MSWLNSSLNTLKGQLTTLAQEVLAETAGPGDEEYRGPESETRTAVELLADTHNENEQLNKLCNEKDIEITLLRKQINELQTKIADSGGGSASTSKSPTKDQNASPPLEDSWCWEPDNVKSDNDHSSQSSSSGNGNEMVNITLEEVPLGHSAQTSSRKRGANEQTATLQKRNKQLEEENKQLSLSLEELDSQHNLAMQNVLELKTELQEKLSAVTTSYEALKKEHADKFINSELEMARLKKQLDTVLQQQKAFETENQQLQMQVTNYEAEVKKSIEDMADLQALLDKKTLDNVELIEKVKSAGRLADKSADQMMELQQRVDQLTKELEDAKQMKEKKTSESSTSSMGKHSDDEFIVVRDGDANSSGPATPPTKEELKDKIVQLENRVSELTLENGSLALKLQDSEMEKQLAVTVLRENVQELQTRCEETDTALKLAREELEEQQEKLESLKEKAAEAVIAQQQLKTLAEEKGKIETEILNMKENLQNVLELEKRLLFSESEKETLQIELQGMRATQERITELESKVQNLIVENQQLRLNAEAETETQNYSAELAERIKSLNEENETLRAEMESIAHSKFREAIAEEKQEITDLDADDDEPLTVDKIKELLSSHIKSKLTGEMEEACRAVQERVTRTVNEMERNISRLSEELLDLQDSKLVWDHEKKTLEADISQYILQCDELMKNNEILLNELENYKRNKLETIQEHNEQSVMDLEAELEEASKMNETLEQEYVEQKEKNEELEREKQTLTEELRAAQQQCEELRSAEKELKIQLETLEIEKGNMLFELNEQKSLDSKQTDDDALLKNAEEKCQNLESQLAHLSKDHADLVAALQTQKAALQEAIIKREEAERGLLEKDMLIKRLDENLKEDRSGEMQKKLDNLSSLNRGLEENLLAKDIVLESQKKELLQAQTNLDLSVDKVHELEELVAEKEKALETSRILLEESGKAKDELSEQLRQQKINVEQLTQLKQEKETLLNEFEELKKKCEAHSDELKALQESSVTSTSNDASAITRITQLEAELLATVDLQKSVATLNYEKNEMIKALQQKHAENMQYYTEIQRLQGLLQQQQQQTAQVTPYDKCTTHESTLSELRKELEKQQDQIKFLKEKSDILTTNLLTEQTNQRLVNQEKADVEEQNVAIRKDLERLREHLLEIEDLHTQETVEMQRELEETKAKMVALQDDVAKSSNAYTSASIRANQHAETLQAQYALVIQQRDELVNKLSLAEDRESKNQAALCNLQCALEQFQNDKQNDIKAATHSIRKELQQEQQKQAQLQAEIGALQQQLSEAKQGLCAAARLGDQLEGCQRTIAVLREEVETLKQQNEQLSTKLKLSESSQSDKIEKSLIKSLLIGYVVSSNPNDKNQVLRMISSVLDFSQSESDKVGLNKQQSSWLGAILGGGAGAQGVHSKENLVQAFVQFLEQESQPKPDDANMPNLLNITQQSSPPTGSVSQSARRVSTSSNSGAAAAAASMPAPIPIQPLLVNDFAPSRNSSSILKDILNDS
ncbi:thyroid receptor-interacting protein 11 isoform X1 [Bactrocera dorsalis]|uniref:Thyroid receptor-interacting protein 11 isoform X1 n=2 Tax=Bactrocera dorsalis TaxID=27457 RepID=A0A6I9VG87_BACDO|nr:thyroid receptor-interacting protein 11 isoform X1 [Bactrocera dorsalis]